MSIFDAGLTLATTRRVLQQLRHDPRTVALLIVVPSVLLALLAGVLHGRRATFDLVGPPLVGIFPLISMFLVTSVAMLRERTKAGLESARQNGRSGGRAVRRCRLNSRPKSLEWCPGVRRPPLGCHSHSGMRKMRAR